MKTLKVCELIQKDTDIHAICVSDRRRAVLFEDNEKAIKHLLSALSFDEEDNPLINFTSPHHVITIYSGRFLKRKNEGEIWVYEGTSDSFKEKIMQAIKKKSA